jgi:hypothetical protein
MRSGQLDSCFDREEREFLFELVESELEEADGVLAAHVTDRFVDDAEIYSNMVTRQQRRIAFLTSLRDNLFLDGGESN